MDPATGAITLVGAAVSLVKCIEKIRQAREYPKVLSSVLAEIADLQIPLTDCDGIIKENGQLLHRFKSSGLEYHLETAKQKLEELENTLKSYTASIGLAPGQKLEAFWTALIRGKSRVDRCRDEFRKIREGLAMLLQVLTTPTVIALHSKVEDTQQRIEDITLSQKDLISGQKELLKHVLALAAANEYPKPGLPPSYHSIFRDDMTRSTHTNLREPQVGTKAIAKVPLPPDRLGKYCVPWCSCRCHTPSSLNSPLRYLKDIVGAVTISHSGLPGLTKECDEKRCHRRVSPKLSVSYDFPRYIMQRRFVMSYSSSSLAGPEIRVRLPRVVDWTSPVWNQATAGNVMAVESLFRSGLASPWDVSPVGGNLLHYATDHWNPDMCRLLLESGLDPSAEDDFKSTAVCIAWERVLSGKMTTNEASMVASLFKDSDYLSTRSFTIVHKIVLGLISTELDPYLEGSTKEIDTKDSRGRTPISWAAARGDEESVSTLLRHGANPNIPDVCGHFPVHYVQNTACAKVLLEHGARLDVLNGEGQTPLYSACRNIGSASLTEFFIQARAADVDKADFSQQTPLHAATGNGKYLPFVDVLLDAGADINARNSSGDTPLRFAIFYNMHDLLLQMLTGPIVPNFSQINNYGQCFAHAIARTADLETVRILTEAKPTGLRADVDLHDVSGKTSLEYFEERLAYLTKAEQDELREAFLGLIQALNESESKFSDSIEVIDEVQYDVPSFGKFSATIRIKPDSVVEAVGIEEVFHDAVESFG